jgi:hypothetical protein
MSNVSMKTTLNASADAVWTTVRDFGGVRKFVASLARCRVEGSGVGATRTVGFEGGGDIVERLESLDDAKRTLTYSIVKGELPFENYLSTMAVRDLGRGRCELAWSSTFEPQGAPEADVKAMIEGVYSDGFAGLKKLHGA